MIAMLKGAVGERDAGRVVLFVGGVGYEVFAPNRTIEKWAQASDDVVVHVHTHVQEDAISLFGFDGAEARDAFRLLLTVSGVGPKMALAALDALTVDALARAVEQGDVATLSKVKGIGSKTAQKVAIDLKGKLRASFAIKAAPAAAPKVGDPLPLALEKLGYSRSEIMRAVEALAQRGVAADEPVATRLRAALQVLSGGAS